MHPRLFRSKSFPLVWSNTNSNQGRFIRSCLNIRWKGLQTFLWNNRNQGGSLTSNVKLFLFAPIASVLPPIHRCWSFDLGFRPTAFLPNGWAVITWAQPPWPALGGWQGQACSEEWGCNAHFNHLVRSGPTWTVRCVSRVGKTKQITTF